MINIPITYTPSSRVVDLDALGIKPLKITKTQLIFSKQDISTITAYLAKKENKPDPPSILVGAVLKGTGYVDGVSSGIPFSKVDTGTPGSNGACDTRPASFSDEFTNGNLLRGSRTLTFNQTKFGDFSQLNDLFQKYNPDMGSINISGLSFQWAGQPNDPVEPFSINFKNVSAGPFSLEGYATITPTITYTPPTFGGLLSLKHDLENVEFSAGYDVGLKGQISLTAQAFYKSDYNLDEDPEDSKTDPDAYPQPLYNYPISSLPIPIGFTPAGIPIVWGVPRLILQSGISSKAALQWKHTENFDVHIADSFAYQQSRCKTFFGIPSLSPCSDGFLHPSAPVVSGSISEPSSGNGFSGLFHVDVMPFRATLLLEITPDPLDAYYSDDKCLWVAPAAVLRTDIIADGTYDSASKKSEFKEYVQVRGRLGTELNQPYDLKIPIPFTQRQITVLQKKKYPSYLPCFDIHRHQIYPPEPSPN